MTDETRARLAELLAKPLLSLTVAEAIFVALELDDDGAEDDVLTELLIEAGLPVSS